MRFESKNAQIKRFLATQCIDTPSNVDVLTQPEQSTSNFLYSGDDIISGEQLIMYINNLRHSCITREIINTVY